MDKAPFMTALKRDHRYANYNSQEREQLWADHKEIAKHERVVSTRGLLGVDGPTIDLNTCSMDHLERVPKLTMPIRKAIINKRNNLPGQRYTSWDQLQNIAGLGSSMLESMKCFIMILQPDQVQSQTKSGRRQLQLPLPLVLRVIMSSWLDNTPWGTYPSC